MAELTIECGTAAAAQVVAKALALEAADGPEGSSTRLKVQGVQLLASVTADDVSALRAAINSVARLADAALRSIGADA